MREVAMASPGAERRRRSERVAVHVEGRLEGRSTSDVLVVDVSLTGCLVRGPRALDHGAIFDLHLPLTGCDLVSKVRVAECSRDGSSPEDAPVWLAGLEFIALPVEHRERLRKFLEGARRRPRANPAAL